MTVLHGTTSGLSVRAQTQWPGLVQNILFESPATNMVWGTEKEDRETCKWWKKIMWENNQTHSH